MYVLYSAVSSALDPSKRFTLFIFSDRRRIVGSLLSEIVLT